MKKLFIALLMFVAAVAFAPRAEAGQFVKVWNGHCYTYVHKSQFYDNNCHSRGYRSSRYYHRPARVYYSQPVRYYRGYDYCDRPVRYYHRSPRFAIGFGF